MVRIIAAATVALLAGPAFAQPAPSASQCPSFRPLDVQLPNGDTASNASMTAANTAFAAWAREAQAVLACKRAEAEAARATAAALSAQYSAEAAELEAAVRAWQAEVNEYNVR